MTTLSGTVGQTASTSPPALRADQLTSSEKVSPVPRPHRVPRPTMRDVAKAAAVSLKTVSRVVNDEGGVRPETAARVHEAIVTLGFRRNDMARVLRQGRSSGTLGLVIEDVANPFYSDITRAVERPRRARSASATSSARSVSGAWRAC